MTERTWINPRQLPIDIPVKIQVLSVTPKDDEDSVFFFNCLVHDGDFKGKTMRLYWWRYKKSGNGPRSDFVALCKALLPDKVRNSEFIRSFDFDKKCFEGTPKEFHSGSIRLMLKIKEIEIADVPSESAGKDSPRTSPLLSSPAPS